MMTPGRIVLLLLALAALAACVRLLLAHRRDPRGPRVWRLLVLLALQPLLAGALYLTMFPPSHPVAAGTLTVLTEGATRADVPQAGEGGIALALPEAQAGEGAAARVPDLATALRRHPDAAHVRVVGAGLVPRDRDAARTVAIGFDPPPPQRGLVRLLLPRDIARGAGFAVAGRVEGVPGGRVELFDPAGRRIDAMSLPEGGDFALHGIAFEAGTAEFGLRVFDADGGNVEDVPLPLWFEAAVPPRVLLLAGAPNPETRALRRWLDDADAQVQARIAVGGGLQLGSASLSDAALAEADLLLVDARAWSGLGDGGRARVLDAVRDGLGLLLRADTPLPASALRGLRAADFAIDGGSGTQAWQLPPARLDDEDALRARLGAGSRDAPFDPEQASEAVPALARRSWRVQGAAAVPFASAGDVPAGWWRMEGRGRIGVWTLLDTWLLPLHGRTDLHGELWSSAVATLARVRADAAPTVGEGARVGERIAICGLPGASTIEFPDGRRAQALVDPTTGSRRCAGFWPQVAGWHRLHAGDAVRPFFVAGDEAGPALRLAELREATLQLASSPPVDAGIQDGPRTAPGRAWPWFVAWLLLAAFAWWLERSRVGLAVSPRP